MNVRATLARRGVRSRRAAAPPAVRYLRGARIGLTAWYVGVLCVLLLIAGGVVYVVLTRVRAEEIDNDLRSVAAELASRDLQALDSARAAAEVGAPIYASVPDGADNEYAGPNADVFSFFFALPSGALSPTNPRNLALLGLPDSASTNQAVRSGRRDIRTVTKSGQRYRILSEVLRGEGPPVGLLQVGKSLRPYEHELHDTALVMLGAGLGAVALAAVGGLLVAGRALRPAQQGWERQQAFVADASHELRTPLALIRADAEVLLRKPERQVAENADLVEDIIHETDHLSTLVADLLVLTRLDAGQLPLNLEPIDAGRLLKELGVQTTRLLVGREIGVVVRALPDLVVCADRERLVQALRILVDNAQRHTLAGGCITLSARPAGDRVRIRVEDTGSGIAPEHLKRVFERFYRVDDARGRSDGGAGLGLAIARGIVEAHRGRLHLVSELGRGTAAIIDLPA